MSNAIVDSLSPRARPRIRVRCIPAGMPFVQTGFEVRPPTPFDGAYSTASEDLIWRTRVHCWEPPFVLTSAMSDKMVYTTTPTLTGISIQTADDWIPIRPCPFCGDTGEVQKNEDGSFSIHCTQDACSAYCVVGPCPTLEEAREVWNHRA